ncbi:MAG: hypothetical protein ETSY2_44895 [Candidatus Entotheonella gemina]|uniref:Uncharacterized protein n=1 Tax=Candidatus Entotheonella gemina TaxID=1429439 RepID=W4LIY6_9BACT|nr:MAG: hypothetical protein ETSY2_44895 [Candidatus Entotheonella gemina]
MRRLGNIRMVRVVLIGVGLLLMSVQTWGQATHGVAGRIATVVYARGEVKRRLAQPGDERHVSCQTWSTAWQELRVSDDLAARSHTNGA